MPVECVEQGVVDRLLIAGQVVEPLTVLTRDASWRDNLGGSWLRKG
jgi:hypothetical protein